MGCTAILWAENVFFKEKNWLGYVDIVLVFSHVEKKCHFISGNVSVIDSVF